MDIKFEENRLCLPSGNVSFKHNIDDILETKGKIIILVDIPNDDETVDNIFAMDINGKKLWRVQSLTNYNPDITQFSPYVGISLMENGNISATNYFGMSYEISIEDGKILGGQLSK